MSLRGFVFSGKTISRRIRLLSGSGRFFTLKIQTMSFYEFCVMNGKEVDLAPIDVFKMHELTLSEQTGIFLKTRKALP